MLIILKLNVTWCLKVTTTLKSKGFLPGVNILLLFVSLVVALAVDTKGHAVNTVVAFAWGWIIFYRQMKQIQTNFI